jgi:hypothetical protein
VGSNIQKIRQRNTAETHLVNLIKKQHKTKKKREKKAKKCALDKPCARSAHIPYFKIDLAMLWDRENYCNFRQNRAFCSGLKTTSSFNREGCTFDTF